MLHETIRHNYKHYFHVRLNPRFWLVFKSTSDVNVVARGHNFVHRFVFSIEIRFDCAFFFFFFSSLDHSCDKSHERELQSSENLSVSWTHG